MLKHNRWRAGVAATMLFCCTLLLHSAPTAQAAPDPPLLPGQAAPRLRGQLAMRTYSLDFYRLPGGMEAATIRQMALAVEQSIISNTLEIGTGLAGRVAISFEPPQSGVCALRGLTISNQRTIRLFYAPDTSPQRVRAILAHELFHQLQRDYYGERDHRKSDNILLEGMATWGSRAHFLEPNGEPSYRVRVREALQNNALLTLTTNLEADCRTSTRSNIYNQWASFVEYLLERHGRARFDEIYRAGNGRAAGSAGYKAVYGKTLPQLEADWRTWVQNQ